ncbi:hypothetical protein [Streptomyces sp. NPDC058385]|uniref:hypothetical protein n=1 Tax=Streptomyces sp. NPDC058385 TaxID=3346473 RepID=UPI0036461D7D
MGTVLCTVTSDDNLAMLRITDVLPGIRQGSELLVIKSTLLRIKASDWVLYSPHEPQGLGDSERCASAYRLSLVP